MLPDITADKVLGAYLGFACGDALGATVEFMTPSQIQRRHGIHSDIIGGGWLDLPPGQVTDDTEMSLVLGQSIIEAQSWDLQAVARGLVDWLHSDPVDVGFTCQQGIIRFRDEGLLSGPERNNHAGNGACMRNLPVVLTTLFRPDLFEQWSLQQAHLTHNNKLSDAATLFLGRMVRSLLIDNDMTACRQLAEQLIQQYREFSFEPYPGKTSGYIVDTVQTVLHYFFNTDSFESCLIDTVNQGGDADTTGALAGMLAGARFGMAGIPKRWLDRLNDDVKTQIHYQAKHLVRLADALRNESGRLASDSCRVPSFYSPSE